jgi:hypothetical protein
LAWLVKASKGHVPTPTAKHKTPGQVFQASRSVPTKQSAPADENVWPVFADAENHSQWGNNHSANLHFQHGQAVELLAQLMGSNLQFFHDGLEGNGDLFSQNWRGTYLKVLE